MRGHEWSLLTLEEWSQVLFLSTRNESLNSSSLWNCLDAAVLMQHHRAEVLVLPC